MNEELREMHSRQYDRNEWRRVATFLTKNINFPNAVPAPYHVSGNDANLHAFVHDGVDPSSTTSALKTSTVERHRGRLPASYILSTALLNAPLDGNVETSALLLCV